MTVSWRFVRLRYDDEAEAFRAGLLAWLEANPPAPSQMAEVKRSSGHLPGWPPELGGRNATPAQQMIYFEELASRQIPRSLNPQGLSICTPSIIDHGTQEQRERWALPTLRAEITWCLGMSEPEAGSDLAGLRTRAVLDGDRFIVNGQKVWTSGAHHADWCLCFVLTNPDVPKHKGISALVIDMRSPGLTCRPLPELTESDFADFNEVFFSDVEVPRENLLGELDNGWRITQGSLAHERGMLWIGNAMSIERNLDALLGSAQERGIAGDPVFRDEFAQLWIDGQAMKLMGYRGFAKFSRGEPSPEQSVLKLFSSEIERRVTRFGTESLGEAAIDVDIAGPPWNGWRAGSWAQQYLRSFSGTIAGGTSEIQRNIVAERVLGLPRS